MIRTLLILTIAVLGKTAQADTPFATEPVATFDQPWALAFLPDGRMLVSERGGNLWMVGPTGEKLSQVGGLPSVDYGGQGGLGDVALHPQFGTNRLVYWSYAEAGERGVRGAAVARGRLVADGGSATIEDVEVIWRQVPKVSGRGHYGHRLLFDREGYLFVSSGERQKFTPAQNLDENLGKILRLTDDGQPAEGNPFAAQGGVAAEVWSYGHRNPLGIDFDASGQLWNVEMGPAGGDELNRVVAGNNYGYPIVSNGNHYSGRRIPDHDTRPEFAAPKAWWTPVISPGDLMIYTGTLFPEYVGDAFIAGLSARGIVRVELGEDEAREVERFPMGKRIRGVVQGPAGAIWVLEDGRRGRLLRLTPNR